MYEFECEPWHELSYEFWYELYYELWHELYYELAYDLHYKLQYEHKTSLTMYYSGMKSLFIVANVADSSTRAQVHASYVRDKACRVAWGKMNWTR